MDSKSLRSTIEAVCQRLETMQERARMSPQEHATLGETIAELSRASEELVVASEEILQQNDEAVSSHQAMTTERDRYSELFDFAPDGYVTTDVRGIIREANRAVAAMFDVPQKHLAGQPLAVFVAEEDRSGFRARLDALKSASVDQGWEFLVRPRRGVPIDVLAAVNRVCDPAGRLTGFRWVLRDISERKRAEEAFVAAHYFYDQIISNAAEGIIVYDRELRYTLWNRFMEELTGLSAAEVLGRCCLDLFPHLREHGIDRLLQRALEGESCVSTDIPFHVPRTGRSGWVSATYSPRRDGNGNVVGIVGIVREITERKRAEEALRRSEARLRETAKAGNVGLWDWDLRTNRVFYSPEWKSQIGYEDHEISDDFAEWESRVHPDDIERCLRTVRAFLEDPRQGYALEFRFRHKDGAHRWMLAQASLRYDDQGRPERMLGSHMDITKRKRAEEAARESERFVRSTLDGLSAHIAIVNEAGRIEAVNKAWREFAAANGLLGAEVCEGINYLDVCERATGESSEGAGDFARAVRDILAGRTDRFEIEYPCHSPDEQRWFVARVTRFPGDGPARAVISHDAITARKLAEAELASERQFSENVLESLPGVFYAFDEDGRYVRWNRRTESLFGYSHAALARGDVRALDFASPKDRERAVEAMRGVFETGEGSAELDLRTQDGREIPYYCTGVRVEADGRRYLVGVGIDISERRRAEEALRKLAHEWQTTFDAVGDAVWLLDRESRIVRCNEASERLLRGAGEIRGRCCWEVVHGTSEALPDCPFPRMMRSLQRESAEIAMGDRWYEVTLDPIRDEAGALAGAVHVMSDITERKQAAERLSQLQKLEALGELSAGVAHDFGNLLVPIQDGVSRAAKLLESNPQALQHLSTARQATEQAMDLARSLLAFGHDMPSGRELVDLRQVVTETVRVVRHTVPKSVRLEARTAGGPPLLVRADKLQLQRVILNLVTNARDAMPNGGTLFISAGPAAEGRGEGRATQDTGADPYFAELVVTDTGSGIAPEIQPRIVDPFFTTKPRGRGTGLGLSVVHGIVEDHDGRIEVQSKAGDAGKGFAVVAEEVRNLAQRAGEAARNTATLIEGSVKNAENGVGVADETAKALREITDAVQKVSSLVNEIAAASREQAQGIDQVSTAVGQMDQVTQQNAANAEESASASEELSAQAEQLAGMVKELTALVRGGSASGESASASAPSTRRKQTGRPAITQRAGARGKQTSLAPADEAIHQHLIEGQTNKGSQPSPKRNPKEVIPLDGSEELAKF